MYKTRYLPFFFLSLSLYNFSYGCEFIGPRRWTLPTTGELSANGGALFVFPCSQQSLVNTSSCQPVQIQTIRRRERRDGGSRYLSPLFSLSCHLLLWPSDALIGLHNLCVYTGLCVCVCVCECVFKCACWCTSGCFCVYNEKNRFQWIQAVYSAHFCSRVCVCVYSLLTVCVCVCMCVCVLYM